jgi:outer membrane biosynthesis protein TonB
MLPGTEKRKPRNSSKVNLLISLTFHSILVLSVFYFAARQGYLGKTLNKIAVEMVKPPDKPKPPETPPEKPPVVEPDKVIELPKPEPPKAVVQAPPPSTGIQAPPSIAPAAAQVADFYIPGGAQVQTSSDPVEIYKGLLEYSLRTRWDRPQDMDDQSFVAEVEVAVDPTGRIADPVWKKKSGQPRWDDSVLQAVAKTQSVSRAPPTNFPSRVVLRFDVVAADPVVP